MKRRIGGFLILSIILLSSMLTLFQNSPLTNSTVQNQNKSDDNSLKDDPFSIEKISDYSEMGEDIHFPSNLAILSQNFYNYKNSTLIQSNTTIDFLITNLWDSVIGGFNESDDVIVKKRTFDNMLMIVELLELHTAEPHVEYITYAEEIFNFEYNYLWDNQKKLFLSFCNPDGSNPSNFVNSTDNILAVFALLKLYTITNDQTYLDIANLTLSSIDSVFRDTTNGGYFRSNLTSDTNKYAYDNFLLSLYLAEIVQTGLLSSNIRNIALNRAENTLDLLILNYLNGTYGFFTGGDQQWLNPLTDKSAGINALAMSALIAVYDINSNQSYLEIADEVAQFIDISFWDSTGISRGYNTTVSWDASTTISSTKYLEVNSMVMLAFLRLFEISYNSTHYQNALKVSDFLDLYLWDANFGGFEFSADFSNIALNITTKTTVANGWAIQALLGYRYSRPFLERANTTMALVNQYMFSAEAFDNLIMYDWKSPSSKTYSTTPFITLADLVGVYKSSPGNIQTIYTLIELAEETQLADYLRLANKTMYYLYQNMYEGTFLIRQLSAQNPDPLYSTETAAWGILTLLKLYEKTGDTLFLEMVNETWYFMRDNFWDYNLIGYNQSTLQNNTKDVRSNSLMIWANLEIANSNYPILSGIRTEASLFANQTFNTINQKMWSSTYSAYFTNATNNWNPITNGNNIKKTAENIFLIQNLIRFNQIYPNNLNKTTYEIRINKTIEFLLNYLWDWELGGFYYSSNDNGSSIDTNKYTYGNNWATITFLNLYSKTGNFTYYLMAEKTNNFVNTYLWDYDYGGYLHWCSQDGIPYATGTLTGVSGELLLSFKFLENQISSVLALTKLSDLKSRMNYPLIVDIEIQPQVFDQTPHLLNLSLKLIDIEGNPIKSANVSILINGFYKTIAAENFYGFAKKDILTNQYGTNAFSGVVDISKFFTNFHIAISVYNESMAVNWFLFSGNRTLGLYLFDAFDVLNNLNYFFKSTSTGSYINNFFDNNTFYTYDNWMAILSTLEFYNVSGLNLLVNYSSFEFEQILLTDIAATFDFINSTLFYSPINSSSVAYYSLYKYNNYINPNITCIDTALATITLLKLHEITNNTAYLELANKTWEFLNVSFWDPNYLGYITINGTRGNQTKYSIDNIWAILANLAIFNSPEISTVIRNQALAMANLTLIKLLQYIWDPIYYGFYSAFNGSSWVPYTSINETSKQSMINALAIQMLVEFAESVNNSQYEAYINYANETLLFMNIYLKDPSFLGYFTSGNINGTKVNNFKTLTDNSFLILALLDLYRVNNNYSYYQMAEEIMIFTWIYLKNPAFTIYHDNSSRFGSFRYDMINYVPIVSQSNFMFVRALAQTDLKRQNLKDPLVIDNIKVEGVKLGEVQNTFNVTLEVFDSDGNPISDASVIAFIYGGNRVYRITNLVDNTYNIIIDAENLTGNLLINFGVFKEGHSAGTKEYYLTKQFPTYIQKAYETLIAILIDLWDSQQVLINDDILKEISSRSNFRAIESLLDFIEIAGDISWLFNFDQNGTFLEYSKTIISNLEKLFKSGEIQVDSKNVTGFMTQTQYGYPLAYTESETNSLAILTLLDLYHQTGNPLFLEQANNTWLYLNRSFWDFTNSGYITSNVSAYGAKNIYDNCFCIWANLAINKTIEINPIIRSKASYLIDTTMTLINQSFRDYENESYYTFVDYNWDNPRTKTSDANSLMILTFLKLYSEDPSRNDYLRMANRTAEILINYFMDPVYGGLFSATLDNFTVPLWDTRYTNKSLYSQAWAILALSELFSATGNTTFYYKAEEIMNFVNTYLANHFNQYLNNEIADINGYWVQSNRSGYVDGKTAYQFVGTLETNALIVQALIKLYKVANLALPWLNATVQLLPSVTRPAGEYCNLTIAVFNENGIDIKANLNITMIGWKRFGTQSKEIVIKSIKYEYDTITQKYKVKDINLTGLEDIYFSVSAKNASYIIWWNVFYLHRTLTSLYLRGVGGDYIVSEDYWQFTIGEDIITIESRFLDQNTFQPIGGAPLNYTVYFPNSTKWFSQILKTNSTGWGRLVFGPVPNIAAFFGQYNITVSASHTDISIIPKTWYASTRAFIKINLDFGISVPYFYPIETLAAQGDIIQCNVTIKHRMLANLSVNIIIYSEGVLIPTINTQNLTTGLNYFIVDATVDERAPIGSRIIYVNVSYEDKIIRDTYFFITILSAAVIRDYYVPLTITPEDTRYVAIEFEHRKKAETSNISVQINCPALKFNRTIQVLPIFSQDVYYFPISVKDNIPYGVYSGEIIVTRVNYTLTFNLNPLTFQIEVKPSLELGYVSAPTEILQNQQGVTAIQLTNNKQSSITVKIVGYGEGFNSYEAIYNIDPTQTRTINTPIIYYKSPWDTGLREYTIEIYYLNESSQFSLISSNIVQIEVKYSINNILLGYVLPSIIVAIVVIFLFWYRDKKQREKKKLK